MQSRAAAGPTYMYTGKSQRGDQQVTTTRWGYSGGDARQGCSLCLTSLRCIWAFRSRLTTVNVDESRQRAAGRRPTKLGQGRSMALWRMSIIAQVSSRKVPIAAANHCLWQHGCQHGLSNLPCELCEPIESNVMHLALHEHAGL